MAAEAVGPEPDAAGAAGAAGPSFTQAPAGRAPAGASLTTGAAVAGPDSAAEVVWAAEQVRVAVADLTRAVNAVRGPVAVSKGEARLEAMKSALTVLDGASDVLASTRLGLVHQVKEAVEAAGAKPGAFVEQRARDTRQGLGAARGEEQVAATLALLPAVQEASQDGSVTLGHVNALSQVLQGASEDSRQRFLAVEKHLVEAARTVNAPEYKRGLKATLASWEADAADHTFNVVRDRRHLTLTARDGGIKLDGLLDIIAGETLRTALETLTPDPAKDDNRTPDQRRADALVMLATRTLTIGDAKAGAQVRPHLSILIREDTWHLLTHRRRLLCDATRGAGAGAGAGPGTGAAVGPTPVDPNPPDALAARTGAGAETGANGAGSPFRPGYPIAGVTSAAYRASGLETEPPLAQLLDGTLIPFAALDVLACDALMQRVILDPDGSPLNIGRTARTFTKDLRRAVLARDRHCQFPGCTLRGAWSEVHHLQFWNDDGPTSLTNGITLCSRHHHQIHREAITITKIRGGFSFTTLHGTHIGNSTRYNDELLIPKRPPRPGGDSGSGGHDPKQGHPPGSNAPPGGGPPPDDSSHHPDPTDHQPPDRGGNDGSDGDGQRQRTPAPRSSTSTTSRGPAEAEALW